jgi:outer membrane lipoprotein SlyB
MRPTAFITIVSVLLTSCRSAPQTAAGAAQGAGVGALAGAVLGSRIDKPLQGAAIGGAAGGVIGGAAGASQDIQQAQAERSADERYKQALAVALRNEDIIQMVRDGQSEDVILNAIDEGVTYFDLSPGGLSQLKLAGVSDKVIVAMQKSLRVRRPPTLKSLR